jgi:hypothetical protein
VVIDTPTNTSRRPKAASSHDASISQSCSMTRREYESEGTMGMRGRDRGPREPEQVTVRWEWTRRVTMEDGPWPRSWWGTPRIIGWGEEMMGTAEVFVAQHQRFQPRDCQHTIPLPQPFADSTLLIHPAANPTRADSRAFRKLGGIV